MSMLATRDIADLFECSCASMKMRRTKFGTILSEFNFIFSDDVNNV